MLRRHDGALTYMYLLYYSMIRARHGANSGGAEASTRKSKGMLKRVTQCITVV